MNRKAWVFAAAALFAATVAGAQDAPKGFSAGAATSNVTPWLGISVAGYMNDRKADHVHDELNARCLVLDDGATKIAFAVVDSCAVPRDVVDDAKRRIHEATGIDPRHVLVSATHTHTAPAATPGFQNTPDPEYNRYLAVKISDGVRRAVTNFAPAKIAWSAVQAPDHVFNRRWKMKEGSIPPNPFGKADRVQMNPHSGSENLVEPAGPTDPEVPFIFVKGVNNDPIALLANYSLHYVGGEGGLHLSADYFGMFAERTKQLLGANELDPPFVGVMTNGTSGDINNINFRVPGEPKRPYTQMRYVADAVAKNVFDGLQTLEWHDHVTLDAVSQDIELGVRKPTTDELAEAKEIVRKAEGREIKTIPEIYARESVLLADYPDLVPVTIQALRIGELGIVAIPCEVFVEIGLDIKAKSALKPAFTIELANGYNGYLPTAVHHELGGYETWRARSSYLEVGAADTIQASALDLLAQLHDRAH